MALRELENRRAWLWLVCGMVAALLLAARLRAPEPPPARDVVHPVPAAPLPGRPAEAAWIVATTLGRDPFAVQELRATARPGTRLARVETKAEIPPPLPRVQILLLDPTRPLALMDRQRVAVGDSIAGYRVVGIDAGGVTLEWRQQRHTVRP